MNSKRKRVVRRKVVFHSFSKCSHRTLYMSYVVADPHQWPMTVINCRLKFLLYIHILLDHHLEGALNNNR